MNELLLLANFKSAEIVIANYGSSKVLKRQRQIAWNLSISEGRLESTTGRLKRNAIEKSKWLKRLDYKRKLLKTALAITVEMETVFIEAHINK